MNLQEVRTLLKTLTAYDDRNVGETDFLVWGRQMADVDLPDALEAVHQHYGQPGAPRAMPGDVRARAEKVRNARTKRPEVVAPGCYEPDPVVRQRLGIDSESRLALTASADITRTNDVKPGPAAAREVLGQIMARLAAQRSPAGELSKSDEIHQRALQRAAADRRPPVKSA